MAKRHNTFHVADTVIILEVVALLILFIVMMSNMVSESLLYVFVALAPTGFYVLVNALHLEYTKHHYYTVFGLPAVFTGVFLLFILGGVVKHSIDPLGVAEVNLAVSYFFSLCFFTIAKKWKK